MILTTIKRVDVKVDERERERFYFLNYQKVELENNTFLSFFYFYNDEQPINENSKQSNRYLYSVDEPHAMLHEIRSHRKPQSSVDTTIIENSSLYLSFLNKREMI